MENEMPGQVVIPIHCVTSDVDDIEILSGIKHEQRNKTNGEV